jgi:hypothetical protein
MKLGAKLDAVGTFTALLACVVIVVEAQPLFAPTAQQLERAPPSLGPEERLALDDVSAAATVHLHYKRAEPGSSPQPEGVERVRIRHLNSAARALAIQRVFDDFILSRMPTDERLEDPLFDDDPRSPGQIIADMYYKECVRMI